MNDHEALDDFEHFLSYSYNLLLGATDIEMAYIKYAFLSAHDCSEPKEIEEVIEALQDLIGKVE